MNRITKWIQERKMYSSPVFGLMLIINVMVFPVFQASARIVEPVQMMPQSAEEVVDALNAVQVGVSVDDAFGIQPVPYRDFTNFLIDAYGDLFQMEMPPEGDGYMLDIEVDTFLNSFILQGHTPSGLGFELEIAHLYVPDYSDASQSDLGNLSAIDDNTFGVMGVIRTEFSEFYFYGMISQFTHLGDRVREIVPLALVEQEIFDSEIILRDALGLAYVQSDFSSGSAGDPEPTRTPYQECMFRANRTFTDSLDSARLEFNLRMAIVIAVAAVVAAGCIFSSALPVLGWRLTLRCLLRVGGTAAAVTATLGADRAVAEWNASTKNFNDMIDCCTDYPVGCLDDPQ